MIAVVETERTDHQIPVAVSLRALDLSESWFYKHRGRAPTKCEQRRTRLDVAIKTVFEAHDGEYGSPRVHLDLIEKPGWEHLSVNTVAVRMNVQGLCASKKRRPVSLTRPDKEAFKFPNLLARNFNPVRPDEWWCGDITEIKTWEGKIYLATVIDLYARRLIGWAIADDCKATLVCDALKMAIAIRGGEVAGVQFHSDRGTQYTANRFTELCERNRIVQSMSRSGSCHDNAVAESFFATLKKELIYRHALTTKAFARQRMIDWFDRYNQIRRHSHCAYQAPIEHEHHYASPPNAVKSAA